MKKLLSLLLAVCMVFSMVTVAAVSVGAAEVSVDAKNGAAASKTIYVGVITYLTLDKTGYQVHYWGGAAGAKNAALTPTGQTAQQAVGAAYWSNEPQTFDMYTAEIPADATGYKVFNGDKWFGDNGDPAANNTAYVFEYGGGYHAFYAVTEPPATEPPVTEAPTTEAPVTSAPATEPTTEEASTIAETLPYNMYVDLTAVKDEVPGSYWFAWTWADGKAGKWSKIQKFGYVAVDSKVLFANFETDTPDWKAVKAQTVDFDVINGDQLKLLPEKDEKGHYKGVWKSQETTEAPTTEPATEPTDAPTTAAPETEPTTEPAPVEPDYYLFGYINGANYACEEDAANLGEYKFVDGKLVATFETASYVAVRTNTDKWYMTKGYPGDDATSATLYSTAITGESSNKLHVPGGVEVTFTLAKGTEADTFVLSYTVKEEPTTAAPETEPTDAPTTAAPETKPTDAPTTAAPETEPTTEPAPVEPDYYLFGYINGANYACEEDAANLGEYKFVDGKLVATFETASYVAVRTNTDKWYMTKGYPGDDATSATLYSTAITGESSNKLHVPGGVEVTFTLAKGTENDTFVLSYTVKEEPTTAAPETKPTDAPTTAAPETEPTTEPAPVEPDYYLFGYINGANYACEEDAANLGDYKFVDGKLVATFESASYVAVRTNTDKWYMTKGYPGDDATSATLYSTAITGESSNKLHVPGGVEVTFTLAKGTEADTFVLSYTVKEEPTTAAPETKPTDAPTTAAPETEPTTEPAPVEPDYYLFGYINGANYACEEDAANLGEYKFVDSKLVATFEAASYVAVRTNTDKWYMTKGYPGDDATSATLYSTAITGESSNKLHVPGGVEVTFTLAKGTENDTFVLSYTVKEEPTTAAPETEPTDAPTTAAPETEPTTEPAPVEPDYYLFGYINGANYACEEDAANLGDYKFVDGKLVATFEAASYVAVRTNTDKWYMTKGYPGDDATSATLYSTAITGESSNKLHVPGGVEVTFTLAKGTEDDTFVLSYTVKEEPTTAAPETKPTDAPTTAAPETVPTTEPAPVEPDYYLFGYINGANYACEEDAANLGEYKFVDGKLVATFETASYVAVRTNTDKWYMTKGYPGDDATSATLYSTAITGESSNKLHVPGGVEVTFTLAKGTENDTFVLSYTVKEEPTTAAPETEPTDAPTTAAPETEPTTEPAPVEPDYYLFGYINGANYACEEDAANLGDYKFVDGKLIATFETASYVAVRTNTDQWYMTKGYPGDDATSATLYSTAITGESSNKLHVPGGVEVTFTLAKGTEADTFVLSYTVKEEPTTAPATEPITEPEPQPVLGDVDLDGKVTIDDATLLMRYLVEMEDLTDEQLKLADVNRDGKVNIMDVTDIQRFLAEIIKKF